MRATPDDQRLREPQQDPGSLLGPVGCVGRDHELAQITEIITAATQSPRVMVISGPAGIGKSTLLRATRDRHRSRWAQATPWESAIPGGVVAQLLGHDIDTDPVQIALHITDSLRNTDVAVLVIDDAHHADSASLQAISTLIRHHRDPA